MIGKMFPEHLRNLVQVFEKIREAGLKLQPNKCCLCSQRVEFLGHIISPDGVGTDPNKIEKVATWPVPARKKEVQQIFGPCQLLPSIHRRLFQDCQASAPTHREDCCFRLEWNSFEHLQQKLITAPILAFPDLDRPFILDTDASDKGIGAVLSQRDDNGAECVVAYTSTSLYRAESTTVSPERSFLLS